MARDASELARRLAREAEAVCRYYLSNGKRAGAVLAGWRRLQYAGPLDVRAAPGLTEGTRWQVDGCRNRRAWRSPRHRQGKPWASVTSAPPPRRQDDFSSYPALNRKPCLNTPRSLHHRGWLTRGRKTAVCDLRSD